MFFRSSSSASRPRPINFHCPTLCCRCSILLRGIVDANDSTAQFQWQAAAGDTSPCSKPIYRSEQASTLFDCGHTAERMPPRAEPSWTSMCLDKLQPIRMRLKINGQSKPMDVGPDCGLERSSDRLARLGFRWCKLRRSPSSFAMHRAQPVLADWRVYAPVPGWIIPTSRL